MIDPQPAAVRPRVLSPESGEALPLEDEIRRLLETGAKGPVALLGPPGSGKTTALRHLAATFPAEAVTLLDQPQPEDFFAVPRDRLFVYTAISELTAAPDLRVRSAWAAYMLAEWGRDELIEYTLAMHRPRCKSVLARAEADFFLLGGVPELWAIVLDRLAADEGLPGARAALHRHLEEYLADTDLIERARSACLNARITTGDDLARSLEVLARPGFTAGLLRVLRHPAAQLLLAGERMAADLHTDADCDFLAARLPRDLVRTAARLVAGDERAFDHLRRLLAGPAWSHAMSASLLHAAGTGWAPAPGRTWSLAGAYFEGASWPAVQLVGANLVEADLTDADLRGADLSGATAVRAVLSYARLGGAYLSEAKVREASLAHADLSSIQAEGASFEEADLTNADLSGAQLRHASFANAELARARFRETDLTETTFTGARLAGADFWGANLSGADLSGLCLREAHWEAARFPQAKLARCDLEYVTLFAPDFESANLESALLTGTSMPQADFRRASLREAGLADIDWEGADLRGADLRGATFHMGSSRSGLVGSTIACEGSRTGFYTDDSEEQHYKAPEEIRKANLCGADLRGAAIDGVDFYLVDLRGALLSPEQVDHLRRSGAILGERF
jgi:uncharacterized protein YjbI with pentapeptide repeats